MNFIDKLERRFPHFGIPNLMKYVICLNIVGAVIGLVDSSGALPVSIYAQYLSLNFYQILHGQVWRLVTFILYPVYDFSPSNMFINLVWFAIWVFLYYHLGTALERAWGTFRFNLFYIGGIVFVIIVTLVFYLINCAISGAGYSDNIAYLWGYYSGAAASLTYLNQTIFLAYAFLYPESVFLMFFLIPMKGKWMAWISLVFMGYDFIRYIIYGNYYGIALIVGALLNFLLFYIFGRGTPNTAGRVKQSRRKKEFTKRARPLEYGAGTARHRCAICGRTDEDSPGLEFRYCSKCNGNYEYCSDHLFSHEHVR